MYKSPDYKEEEKGGEGREEEEGGGEKSLGNSLVEGEKWNSQSFSQGDQHHCLNGYIISKKGDKESEIQRSRSHPFKRMGTSSHVQKKHIVVKKLSRPRFN
eukprot:15366832-Ditylum_brightwellii.AAC.1